MKRSSLASATTSSASPSWPVTAEQLVARTLERVSAVSAVAHPSDDEIATMLAIEAARRRRRAEEVGLRSYLDPLDRPSGVKPGNVNKNFLTATIRSVETHNRREEEADCWRTYEQQKVAERFRERRDHTPDGRHKPQRKRTRSRSRSRSRSPSRTRWRSCSRSQSPQHGMRTHAHRHSQERESVARPRVASNSPSPRALKPTPVRVVAPSPPIRRQVPGAWPRGVAMSDDEGELALAQDTFDEGDGRSKECPHEASSDSGSGHDQTDRKRRKKEKRDKKEKKRRRKDEKKAKKEKQKG